MNIREIKPAAISNFDIPKFRPEETKKELKSDSITRNQHDKVDISKTQNWQQDILLEGLNLLENKIQMANNSSSPLDKVENKPIETFEEALKELNFIKSNSFRQQASQAQANISPEVFIELMSEFAA